MMGEPKTPQPSLFYPGFNLEKRIRSDHPLRRIARTVDFDFVSDEVRGKGNKGVRANIMQSYQRVLHNRRAKAERNGIG